MPLWKCEIHIIIMQETKTDKIQSGQIYKFTTIGCMSNRTGGIVTILHQPHPTLFAIDITLVGNLQI